MQAARDEERPNNGRACRVRVEALEGVALRVAGAQDHVATVHAVRVFVGLHPDVLDLAERLGEALLAGERAQRLATLHPLVVAAKDGVLGAGERVSSRL